MLRIDDKDACTLNNMWSLISNVHASDEDKIKNYENSGNVGSQGTITYDGVNVGTAQFCNAQKTRRVPIMAMQGKRSGPLLSLNSLSTIRFPTVNIL